MIFKIPGVFQVWKTWSWNSCFFQVVATLEIHIDGIGRFGNTWDEHMEEANEVSHWVKENGFKINLWKWKWDMKETCFLDYWLTPKGTKPWKKKVDAVLKLEALKDINQLCAFSGAVTCHCSMWPHHSCLLEPLTELTNKMTWEWGLWQDQVFEEMMAVMASDVLRAFPNHDSPHDLCMCTSDHWISTCQCNESEKWCETLKEGQFQTSKPQVVFLWTCQVSWKFSLSLSCLWSETSNLVSSLSSVNKSIVQFIGG